MRLTRKLQLFLQPAKVFSDRASELEEMDEVLGVLGQACGLDKVLKQILNDVNEEVGSKTWRDGVTAEEILKLGLRKRHGMSYPLKHGEPTGSFRPHIQIFSKFTVTGRKLVKRQ